MDNNSKGNKTNSNAENKPKQVFYQGLELKDNIVVEGRNYSPEDRLRIMQKYEKLILSGQAELTRDLNHDAHRPLTWFMSVYQTIRLHQRHYSEF